MADFHEAVFRWPYAGEDVTLTGTFDQWSRSKRLVRGPSGFEGTVRVPWSEKVAYKFIVDGRWATTDLAPTELDGHGNTNNVYYAPAKPVSFTIVNESPTAAVVSTAQLQDKTPEPLVAADGKIHGTLPAAPPSSIGPLVSPALPVPQDKPASPPAEGVLSPVANGKPVAPLPQDEPASSPAEILAKELPKPVGAVATLPTESQAVASKLSMPIVPVHDSKLVSEPSVVTPDALQTSSTPSTHTPVVNSPRKSLNDSSPLVPAKDEKKANGTNGTIAASPASSPPSTPKKHTFPRSDSPVHHKDGSLRSSRFGSVRAKRDSFFQKLKTMLTPEKDKEKHKTKH